MKAHDETEQTYRRTGVRAARLGTKSYRIMKLAMPPERWTPKGQNPEEHYRRIFEFEKHHFSAKTIYRTSSWGSRTRSWC